MPREGHEGRTETLSRRVRAAVGILVSTVLVWLLLRYVRPASVIEALGNASLPVLVGAVLVHGVQLLLRVQRFAGLVGESGLASRAAFDSVFVGWLSNLALPAKAGELARPLAYRSWSGTDLSVTVAAMVVERALDLVLLGALFMGALALGLPESLPAWVSLAVWAASGLAVAGLVAGVVFLHTVEPGRGGVLGPFRVGLLSLGGVRPLLLALAGSTLIWSLEVVGVVLTLQAVGAEPDPIVAASAVVVVATTLAVAAPAAPGGLGVEQWVTALVLAPFAVEHAAAVAVSLLLLFEAVVWITPVGLLALGSRSVTDGEPAPGRADASGLAE